MPSKKAKRKTRRKAARARAKREEERRRKEEQELDATQTQEEVILERKEQDQQYQTYCIDFGRPILDISEVTDESGNIKGWKITLGECTHGFASTPEETRICYQMVEAFQRAMVATTISSGDEMMEEIPENVIGKVDETLENALNDVAMMEKVVAYLLSLGTSYILDNNCAEARNVAYRATYFERRLKALLFTKQARGTPNSFKAVEPNKVDDHTLVRYFQKRIPCDCLDAKYEEVKSITKMGLCFNPKCSLPDRKAARSKMKYCTRCKQAYYCSKECQIADWKRHKKWCKPVAASRAVLDSKAKENK